MSSKTKLGSKPMVTINYEIPDDLHKRVRILAAQRGTTIKAFLIEALQLLVEAADKEGTDK